MAAVAMATVATGVTAQDRIGQISGLTGDGTITRENIEFRAIPNAPLVRGDALGTLRESSMSFGLLDGSLHSLGPNAILKIEEFAHDPANPAANKLVFRLFSGTLSSRHGAIREMIVETRCGMIKAQEADLTVSASDDANTPGEVVSNYGGAVQIIIRGNSTLVQAGSSASIDENCGITFGVLPERRDAQGERGRPDRIEPPGRPGGEPGPTQPPRPTGQPGPPSPRPTPPVPTPTPTREPGPPTPPPTPTPTPSASPTPTPTATPTASPTLPPPSPTPTPTPVSPV